MDKIVKKERKMCYGFTGTMSLIENIGSYRFDVLELFDQYCIEPMK